MVVANSAKVARNTLFLYLRMIIILVVSLYTTRVLLNALGVVDYGINNVVAGFVSMFAFINTSMANGIQRFFNFSMGRGDEKELNKIYTSALIIQVIISVLLIFLLETIGLWYFYHKMVIPEERLFAASWIFHLSCVSSIIVVLQVPYCALIMANERMDFYAYVSLFDVFAKLAIAFILPHIDSDKLIIYGLYHLAVITIDFFAYYIYCKFNFSNVKITRKIDLSILKSMFSFSGWNVLGTFAYVAKGQGLNVLINAFFGPIINAAKGISGMILSAIQGFQSNIVLAFRPQLVQSYASGEFLRVKNMMYSMSKFSFVMLYLLSVPIVIEIRMILQLWLGDAMPDYTVEFTILVIIDALICSFNTPLSQVIHATGRLKKYQICTSIVITAIIPISYLFLKTGASPASPFVVSIFIVIINQVICLFMLRNVFPFSIKEYIKMVVLPCLFFTITVPIIPILIHISLRSSVVRILLVAFSSVLISTIVAYLVVLNKGERDGVRSYVNRIIHRWLVKN